MAEQRRVLITGVSRGLGRAMTEEFVRHGHVAIGCSRSREAIDDLSGQFSAPHNFAEVDVCDDTQVERWCQRVLESGGPPDLLLNNAALMNRNACLWEVPPDEFSQLLDANIKGVFHVLRHFVPAMIQRGSGVIVNFSSTWGRSTSPEVAPYFATKWTIEGLTRALAQELPRGMAAVPLNPGIIHTQMLETCFGASAASYPSPDSWAETAVPFLLELGPADNGRPATAP